ncbi:PHP domain-containing protein, partial [Candidatus Nomurabacteria bacterium]|nr:PHP domain-containing protein [Candidatus Nomurabacteria bacterium]
MADAPTPAINHQTDTTLPKVFCHLHAHSHYSLLTALPKTQELAKTAKKMGMPAIALTDNGNLYGAIEFYKDCKKEEIKAIIGIDAYVALRTRNDKEAIDKRKTRLVLLAKNTEGYKNLIKIVTASHLEGFYYKPRIDRELLEKYHEGLIAIAPALSSDIAAALHVSDQEKAQEKVDFYKKLFGPDFYLEVSHHPEIENHEVLMRDVIALGKKTGVPLVAGHEVYYLKPE